MPTPRPQAVAQQQQSRKAARRQAAQRQRHQQRELAEVLRERAARDGYPAREEGAPPRID